jgi:glycosyltransferase involved in cell wall biosynthesis
MNSAASSARPTCVLVLGMHRSGTSALTRCLNLVGMDLGSNLLSPAKMNAKGFWEHGDAVRINEQLLEALGLYWYDLGALPDGWLTSVAADATREEIRTIVKRDFDGVPLWGLKDPRLCRLAPLWIEVLQEMGIRVVSVLMIRSPIEVAESLHRAHDLSLPHGVLLWAQHLAESVLTSDSIPRVMVDYEHLLSEPIEVVSKIGRELALVWPIPPAERGDAVLAFLDAGMRTHKKSVSAEQVPPLVAQLVETCASILHKPSPVKWSHLTKISARVAEQLPTVSYLGVAAGFKDRGYAELRAVSAGWVPNAVLYYATDDAPEFSEGRCLVRAVPSGRNQMDLSLPATADMPVRLRFDPLDRHGAYVLHSLVLFDRMGQVLWSWPDSGDGIELVEINLAPSLAGVGRVVAYTGEDPQIHIKLPRSIAERRVAMVRVDMECLDAGVLSGEIAAQSARADFECARAVGYEEKLRGQAEARAEERRQFEALTEEHRRQGEAQAEERRQFEALTEEHRRQCEARAEERGQFEALTEEHRRQGEAQAEERRQFEALTEEHRRQGEARAEERRQFEALTEEHRRQAEAQAEERRQFEVFTKAERLTQERTLEAERERSQLRIDQLGEQLRIAMESSRREIDRLMAIQLVQTRELQAIHASTWWRVMLRSRHVTSRVPVGVKGQLRRALKAVWWGVTPWRLPVRLRFLRERRAKRAWQQPETPHVAPEALHAVPEAPHVASPAPGNGSISFVPAGDGALDATGGYYQLKHDSQRYTYIPPRQPTNIEHELAGMSRAPRFSIVVPVYNTPSGLLDKLVYSVLAQWYPHWELILVNDNSSLEHVGADLARLSDPRIIIVNLAENKRIALATNEGIARALGDFIVFTDHDDELTPDCLYELACCVEREDPDFIYSDEDKIDEGGQYVQPFFKPGWSPDTMMSTMYTCHVSCVRRELVNELGGLRPEYDGCQDWDLILRVVEKTDRIAHVPKVLYHWRILPASVASSLDAKPHVIEASKRAREDAMVRRGLNGRMEPVEEIPGYFRAVYQLQGEPCVSIIIPSKNSHQALKQCVDSIESKSTYRNYEIVIVDHGSTDPVTIQYIESLRAHDRIQVLSRDKSFSYAAILNLGVQAARGELVIFLNDGVEVLVPDWLERMGGYAQLSHVGAVGAKLLYPGGKVVQQVGTVNLSAGPGHGFRGLLAHEHGYFARAVLEYNWLAVTGACLMVERSKFARVGGFDEDIPASCYDVDLCLRLFEAGYYNLASPAVKFVDHGPYGLGSEDASPEQQTEFRRDTQALYQKHPQFYQYDPFHSPNLAPNDVRFGPPQL